MRQFHSHHNCSYRYVNSFQKHVRCGSFSKNWYNLCKGHTPVSAYTIPSIRNYMSPIRSALLPASLPRMLSGLVQHASPSVLHGEAKSEVCTSEWPISTSNAPRQISDLLTLLVLNGGNPSEIGKSSIDGVSGGCETISLSLLTRSACISAISSFFGNTYRIPVTPVDLCHFKIGKPQCM